VSQISPMVILQPQVDSVTLPRGTTITIFLTQKDYQHDHNYDREQTQQVELRVLPDGQYQIFVTRDAPPIQIQYFEDWKVSS